MPIYEYACAACGHEFEEWQKITAEPVRICPKCQEPKVERLISRTAFQLKGGGWYSDLYSSSSGKSSSTDSKGGDAKTKGKETTPASSSGSSSESKSTESKSSDSGASAGKKSDSSKKSESRAA